MPPLNPSQNPPNPLLSSPEAAEIAQLRETVSELAARVNQLEQRFSGSTVGLPPPKPQLESRFGLTLVNRAGALTLAIGIIFFFKYAVDNRWIGAEGRVAVGVVAGLVMLAAAEWMRRGVFTQGLAGCGLATVYVSLYAAFAYYELIIPIAGWSLLVLVSAVAVVLSIRYASVAIAALGFTGAMLTPMLLHNRATAWWFDFLFLLAAALTALAIAIRSDWPGLVPGMAGLAALSAGVVLDEKHPYSFALFCGVLALAHFVSVRRTGIERRLRNFAYLTAHGCLLIAGMRAVALWAAVYSTPDDRSSFMSSLDSFLLALYGTAALVYGMAGRALVDRTLGLVLLAAVIAKLYLWDVWQLNKFYRISAFVALGILLLTASYLYSRFRSRMAE